MNAMENQETAEIGLYIDWIRMVIQLSKWNIYSKVQQKMRKLLKSLRDNEIEQNIALIELMNEHNEFWNAGQFREALIFLEFAHYLDPKDKAIKEHLQETKEFAAVEKEVKRMIKDRDMFPLVTMHAVEWLYEEILSDDELYSFRHSIPTGIMEALESANEDHAYGILRLKKKYPLTFRFFQEEWEETLGDLTTGMNREQRREIR
jgi:hypothetical protein